MFSSNTRSSRLVILLNHLLEIFYIMQLCEPRKQQLKSLQARKEQTF